VAMDNLRQDEWHFQWPDVFYYLESRRSTQVANRYVRIARTLSLTLLYVIYRW